MPNLASHSIDALEARVRSDGGRPLLTYYDCGSGERTELSGTTFGNWVDKTVLLMDDLGVADDALVALPLVHDRPGHWVSLVWVAAVWQHGCRALVVPAAEVANSVVDLTVVGPEAPPLLGDVNVAGVTVACSLHPLGQGVDDLNPAFTDYADVRLQPDVHVRSAGEPAWVGLDEGEEVAGSSGRALVVPGEPWTTVREALVAPLLGGGSSVVVVGGSDGDVERIRTAERAG